MSSQRGSCGEQRLQPHHGGPDGGPALLWDFSSNVNALPPPDFITDVLARADRRHYPDPSYTALRERLSRLVDVEPQRIVPTAGSSEAIRRITLAASLCGVEEVCIPQPAYADYESAARALNLMVSRHDDPWVVLAQPASLHHRLLWLCEPHNPCGATLSPSFWQALLARCKDDPRLIVAIDRAYEPLRLNGEDPVPSGLADRCWQLWSPNKALGLTGVRAGWMVAPAHIDVGRDGLNARPLQRVQALAPSWVMSAEGVALLMQWPEAATQAWLAQSRTVLQQWRDTLARGLTARGWQVAPSVTPFFLARAPSHLGGRLLALAQHARARGIKWRDAEGFGLHGCIRLRAHEPQAQAALFDLLDACEHADAPKRCSGQRGEVSA